MGLFDRIFGNPPRQPAPTASSDDEQAIARYRYMLKTAPPEAMVLEQLRAATPETERDPAPVLADPKELARYATRAEIRQPGTLERTFGAMPRGVGMGGLLAGSLLGSMAGTVLGTAIAQQFLGHHAGTDFGGLDHPHATDAFTDDTASFHDAVDEGGGLDMGDTFDI